MRYSCLPFVPAFGMLPFTPSDPREAFVTVLQQVPEVVQYFMSRITRWGTNQFFLSHNRCPVVGFIPPACRHHDIHADVPVLHILVLHRCVQLFMYPMPTCRPHSQSSLFPNSCMPALQYHDGESRKWASPGNAGANRKYQSVLDGIRVSQHFGGLQVYGLPPARE